MGAGRRGVWAIGSESEGSLASRKPSVGTDYSNLGYRPGTRRSDSDQPANQVSSLAGGLEQGWCRNDLYPSPQHSFASEHRARRSQGVGRHGTPSRASAASQVFIWGQRGNSRGRSRGPMSPLWAPPCTLPYLSPSSQESVVFFFCQFTMIVYVPLPPPPPWGGREGTRPHLLHFFYLGTVPDKITSLVQFFTASLPGCFLTDSSPCSP